MRRLVPLICAGAWRASSIVNRDEPATAAAVVLRNWRRPESDDSSVAGGGVIDNLLLWERAGRRSRVGSVRRDGANRKPHRLRCQAGRCRLGLAASDRPLDLRLGPEDRVLGLGVVGD